MKPTFLPSFRPENRWAALVVALPLATGAALVVHMVTRRSLAGALGLTVGLALLALVLAARHLPPSARADARRRLRIGLVSGAVGLAAYDLSRVLLVLATDLHAKPFKALPLFGRGLLGPDVSDTTAWVAGASYHALNGIGFAVAYCLVARRPSWRTGIAWALLLEAVMIVFYPSWLQIEALKEFVTMSLFGHLAYGGTLGAVAAACTTQAAAAHPGRAARQGDTVRRDGVGHGDTVLLADAIDALDPVPVVGGERQPSRSDPEPAAGESA